MTFASSHTYARALRNALIVLVATAGIFAAFRLSTAGSLTPTAAPAGTMHSAEEVNDVLVGTYDSSGVTGSKNGSALQISKCIISKIAGSPCP